MASLGVTTVEAKSGYGLDEAGETKQLEALERAAARLDLPRVVPTFLALHAIPPEARADRAAYIEGVRERTLPALAARGLARYVDVYVDRAAFSVDEARARCPASRRCATALTGARCGCPMATES
jgi:imidazolonepropionase